MTGVIVGKTTFCSRHLLKYCYFVMCWILIDANVHCVQGENYIFKTVKIFLYLFYEYVDLFQRSKIAHTQKKNNKTMAVAFI